MVLWDYKTFDICEDDHEKAQKEEQAKLQTWGRLGWKLVAVVPTGSIRRRFYLKKRLAFVLSPPKTPTRRK